MQCVIHMCSGAYENMVKWILQSIDMLIVVAVTSYVAYIFAYFHLYACQLLCKSGIYMAFSGHICNWYIYNICSKCCSFECYMQ